MNTRQSWQWWWRGHWFGWAIEHHWTKNKKHLPIGHGDGNNNTVTCHDLFLYSRYISPIPFSFWLKPKQKKIINNKTNRIKKKKRKKKKYVRCGLRRKIYYLIKSTMTHETIFFSYTNLIERKKRRRMIQCWNRSVKVEGERNRTTQQYQRQSE